MRERYKTSKITYILHTITFQNCITSSLYVCVKDICWKFSIYYKFTIRRSLKLAKGIKWWQNNIVLKMEKVKFRNTLKNNVQIRDEEYETNIYYM